MKKLLETCHSNGIVLAQIIGTDYWTFYTDTDDGDGMENYPTEMAAAQAAVQYYQDLEDVEYDPEDMDGDAASALASAGYGTDEDYGDYGPTDGTE